MQAMPHFIGNPLLYFAGHSVLRPPLVMEKLGGRQNPCPDDGLGYRRRAGRGKATEEATSTRLPRRQPEAPQLVGLQILFL